MPDTRITSAASDCPCRCALCHPGSRCPTCHGGERITRNAARCKKCGDVLESRHRHDYRECSCGAIMVDGGLAYIRRGWHSEQGTEDELIEELSEYADA